MSILSTVHNTAATVSGSIFAATSTPTRVLANQTPSSDLKLTTGAAGNLASVSDRAAQTANTATRTAIFPSPRVIIDPAYNKVLIQNVDSATGAVVQQFPSQEVVRRYERTAHAAPEAPAPEASGNPLKG